MKIDLGEVSEFIIEGSGGGSGKTTGRAGRGGKTTGAKKKTTGRKKKTTAKKTTAKKTSRKKTSSIPGINAGSRRISVTPRQKAQYDSLTNSQKRRYKAARSRPTTTHTAALQNARLVS